MVTPPSPPTPTPAPVPTPSPAPTPTPPITASPVGFRVLASNLLGKVTALSALLGAFGWFAGYTYLDRLYTAFALDFGAVSPSLPEVVGLGYLSTIYSLYEWTSSLGLYWLAEAAIAIAIVGMLTIAVKKGVPLATTLAAKIHAASPKIDKAQPYILFGSVLFFLLLAAGPIGRAAADFQISGYKRSLKGGCCFVYSDSKKTIQGRILASDKDHTFVISKAGLDTLKTEELTARPVPSVSPASPNPPTSSRAIQGRQSVVKSSASIMSKSEQHGTP